MQRKNTILDTNFINTFTEGWNPQTDLSYALMDSINAFKRGFASWIQAHSKIVDKRSCFTIEEFMAFETSLGINIHVAGK